MSQALALPSLAAAKPMRATFATMPQTPEGCVTACFALESFDRKRGVATYVLRVINRTTSVLFCRTWVVSEGGEPILAYPMIYEVRPLSSGAMRVPVWPGDFPAFDRAVAEIVGEGVECVVDAAAPSALPRRHPVLPAVAASLALGLLTVAGVAGMRAATPHIEAFAVPPQALAGSTVRAEYDASGAGRVAYSVTAPDGRLVQSGSLPSRDGSIPIAVPANGAPGAYAVQLAMSGPLGRSEETRILNTVSTGAEIGSISVHPVLARPGDTVVVSYAAAADGGYVRLLDRDGTVWAQQPYSRQGQTSFVIPTAGSEGALRVLLHVTRGNSSAESMAGIAVADERQNVAAPAAAVAATDDGTGVPAAADDGRNGTFEVLDGTVHSGDAIRVKIISPRNGMHLGLTDDQSREVAGKDIGAQADEVTLLAPAVKEATRYTVVATFTDGFGQESIVQPVTILP